MSTAILRGWTWHEILPGDIGRAIKGNLMKSAFKWLGLVAGLLLLAAVALFLAARLQGPTSAQRDAVAEMQVVPEPAGRNAFAALWLLPYDVPEAQQEAVAAEDVQRYSPAGSLPADSGLDRSAGFASIAGARYADLRVEDKQLPDYCTWRDEGCLAKVSEGKVAYAKLLERDARLIDRVAALSQYGHVRNEFAAGLDMPFPAYQLLSRTLTKNAHDFAIGKVDAALAGTCRDASTARMLMRSGDNLIGSMIAVVMLQGTAQLFTDMLATLPADHPLPVNCTQAFVPPVADELSVCNAMRGEYRFMTGGVSRSMQQEREKSWLRAAQLWLVYNEEKTEAAAAANLARWCSEDAASMLSQDIAILPASLPIEEPSPWSMQCIDNAAGCILTKIAAPAYSDYQLRLQDSGARLRLVGALLWLREQADGSVSMSQLLTTLPEEYANKRRDLRVSEDGKSLVIDMYETKRNETWQVGLPPYLISDRAAAP